MILDVPMGDVTTGGGTLLPASAGPPRKPPVALGRTHLRPPSPAALYRAPAVVALVRSPLAPVGPPAATFAPPPPPPAASPPPVDGGALFPAGRSSGFAASSSASSDPSPAAAAAASPLQQSPASSPPPPASSGAVPGVYIAAGAVALAVGLAAFYFVGRR